MDRDKEHKILKRILICGCIVYFIISLVGGAYLSCELDKTRTQLEYVIQLKKE